MVMWPRLRGPDAGLARSALGAALLWVVVEFAIRDLAGLGLLGVIVLAAHLPKTPTPPGWTLTYLSAVTGVAMMVLGALFYRRAAREHLRPADLGYDTSRRALAAGVFGGVLLSVLLSWGTHHADTFLFPAQEAEERVELAMMAEAGLPAVMLIVATSLLAPAVEEYAWRGYIQTRLVTVWGTALGVTLTAVLFSAKHVVVDLSLERSVTLLVGSVALGVLRQRWGTGTSTLAHVILNTTSSLQFMWASLRG